MGKDFEFLEKRLRFTGVENDFVTAPALASVLEEAGYTNSERLAAYAWLKTHQSNKRHLTIRGKAVSVWTQIKLRRVFKKPSEQSILNLEKTVGPSLVFTENESDYIPSATVAELFSEFPNHVRRDAYAWLRSHKVQIRQSRVGGKKMRIWTGVRLAAQ